MAEPTEAEQILVTEGADSLPSEIGFFNGENLIRISLALVSLTILVLVRNTVAKVFTKPIAAVTHRYYPDKETHFDKALQGPISFLCIAGGVFLAVNILAVPEEFQVIIKQLLQSFLNVMVFWVLYQSIEPVSEILHKTGTGQISDEMRQVIVDLVKITVVCVGLLALLQAWGVNVGAFLAGLGLVGMAVALAAQDTMRNLFASVAMFADDSFKVGNWIKTPEVEGIVETVSLRTTTIRNFDTSTVVIPNGNLANGTIINFSRINQRRITWTLPLTAPSNAHFQKVVDRLDKYIRDHPKVDQSGPIIINLDEFGEACIKFFVYFMVNEINWLPYMEIKQVILLDFLKIVQEEGCGFGVPTRYVRVHNV